MGLERARGRTELLEGRIWAPSGSRVTSRGAGPPEEQDKLASVILADLESEERWERAFTESQDVLAKLADGALAEAEAGETEPLLDESD